MPTSGIRVLLIGQPLPQPQQGAPRELPYIIHHLAKAKNVLETIATFSPDVILTLGTRPGILVAASHSLQKRWLCFEQVPALEHIIEQIEIAYDHNLFDRSDGDNVTPLVSIYTPTYNTGSFLKEAWESLRAQTYPTFEWVVVDDASTDSTWAELQRLAAEDPRARPYLAGAHNGRIGALKDLATRLCRGEILVELDHDDLLTDNALADIVAAFNSDPRVGFAYSDYAGFFESGKPHRFPATWHWPWNTADRYREEKYHGRTYLVCNQMDIYDCFGTDNFQQQFGWYLTVGPHHVRAFRASTFRQLGGYNPNFPVADDWDIMSKFFIHSRCLHIPKLCYLYRVRDEWSNATFERMQSIQDHLALAHRRRADDYKRIFALRFPAAEAPKEPKALQKIDEPAFVIASRREKDAVALRDQFAEAHATAAIYVGMRSILEAYEAGRLQFSDRRRIVYLHDDVEIKDLPAFIDTIMHCPSGLHGVIGSAADNARDSSEPWWDQRPLYGCVHQKLPDGRLTVIRGSETGASPVNLLDGLCLITVDQTWSWRLPGDPILWHAYDWLACKRTAGADFPVSTIPQPNGPLLIHRGYGRDEGLVESLEITRALARDAAERRDYSNIKDHLPILKQLAHGTVLELGSREGASTSALLEGVLEHGGSVWSVDCDPGFATAWLGHPRWRFVCGDSTNPETIEKLRGAGLPDKIDVLFIDTEHTYAQLTREVQTWLPRMAAGGRILAHDTEAFPEVARALEDLSATFSLVAEFIPGCNGLGILHIPDERLSNVPDPTATLADVSFVVLDATASANAETCLASIQEFAPGAEIILVGNGVEPQPAARALATHYLRIEGNIGFAAGCNRGAKLATRKFLCFMNDDARFVDAGTPQRLLRRVSDGPCIAAPYTNRGKPPQGNYDFANVPQEDRLVPMVTGMCMMIEARTFELLDRFDTRFTTWEDDDLCKRASCLEAQRIIVGGAWVDHQESQTFKALQLNPQEVIHTNSRLYQQKYPNVRVIAIAKNEEAAIDRFVMQFPPNIPVHILDTGSTDNTVKKAERAGAEVQSAPGLVESVGFANARNEALRRFAGNSDWIIMLDPDERLDPNTLLHLPELLFNAKHDIYLAPLIAVYPDGSRREFVAKPFLFRNRHDIGWVFMVHEKVIGSQQQALIANGRIEHIRALHEESRRQKAEELYKDLASREPYFTNSNYRAKMRETWPILDYDHPSNSRIANVHTGPLVSVIIPTFERPSMLAKAVISAQAQTWTNLEIIVVGDCDPMLTLVSAPPGLRVINLPKNHGAGGAVPRNVGIQAAQGEYIAYLDDDNEWLPEHVASIMNEILRAHATWGFSSMSADGIDLGFIGPPRHARIDTSCVVHRKSLFDKYGPWKDRTAANYWHDWELFSRWVAANEPWIATGRPTLLYGLGTSGQAEFLRALAKQENDCSTK